MDRETRFTLNKISIIMLLDGAAITGTSLMVSILKTGYGLDYGFTGLLPAMLSLGNLISGLLFIFLPCVLGTWLSALILSSGIFFGYLALVLFKEPVLLICGFFLIGIGKGTIMNHSTVVSGNKMHDRGKAVNKVNAMYALGSLLSPVFFMAAALLPLKFPEAALMSLFGFVAMAGFFTIKDAGGKSGGSTKNDMSFIREPHFWLSTLFLFFYLCTEISVNSWLVTYFKDTGILSGTLGDMTVTIMWLAMLLGRLTIVYVLPSGSRLVSLSLMSGAAFFMYLLLMVSDTGVTAMAALFLFAFCISGLYPTATAGASRSLNNASMGIMLPLGGIGSIIMPYITGFAAEHIGIRGGMACSLFTIAAMFIVSRVLKHIERKGA